MSPRICPLCGKPLLPGEAKLVPFTGVEDADGQEVEPRVRYHQQAIHARCKLRDPEGARALLDNLPDED